MSGAMSGARPREIGRTFFATRRRSKVLDLADARLFVRAATRRRFPTGSKYGPPHRAATLSLRSFSAFPTGSLTHR